MALSSTFIQQMYVAYFGRPADPGGLTYFAQFDEATLVRGFGTSAESQALYGTAGGSAAVDAVYKNLFNRSAETGGVVYWAGLLATGQISLAGLALSVLRGAANADLTTVNNKVAVAALFTSQVDGSGKTAGYAGNTAAAAARDFLKAVGSDNASVASAQSGLAQAVAAAVAPAKPSSSLALTAAADTITGTTGDDIITGSNPGDFGFGDAIDGGAGNDTLKVTGETGALIANGITVSNVETADLSTSGSVILDTSGWSGLSSLTVAGTGNFVLKSGAGTATMAHARSVGGQQVVVDGGASVTVNATGITGGSVTVGSNTAASGAVVVNASGSVNSVFVKGGTSVAVNAAASTTVMGTAATTAVTLNAATSSALNVLDVNANTSTAGTITSITAGQFNTLNVNGSGLSNLTLTAGAGNVNINNGGAGSAASRTLNLKLDLGGNLGTVKGNVTDAGVYTTLNLAGTANSFSYVGKLNVSAVTAMNISGGGTLDFVIGAAAGLTSLQTVTVGGSARVFVDFSAQNAALTLVDASNNTGGVTTRINAAQTKFVGGAGADMVYLDGPGMGQDIDLGDGDDWIGLSISNLPSLSTIRGGNGNDTLDMLAADAAAITTAGTDLSSKIIGFETLYLNNASGTQAIDLALLGGASRVSLTGATTASLTLRNFVSGGRVDFFDSVQGVTLNGDFSGVNDSLNVQAVTRFMQGYTASMPLSAAGIENINIVARNASPFPSYHNTAAISLQDAEAKVITITSVAYDPNQPVSNGYLGSITVALTTDSTAITSVDASGMPTGNLTWTSGALAGAATVKGSTQGDDSINMAADMNAVTFIGGAGNTTITTGAGNDTITVGAGANVVNVGSGTDRVNITGPNAASTTVFTTLSGMGTGDSVNLGGNVNALGARVTDLGSLQANLNAAAAGNGSGSAPLLRWFTFGGDAYIVKDVSAGAGFVSGTDMVVKLAGVADLGAASVVGGVVTL